jgi:hypothetical protein
VQTPADFARPAKFREAHAAVNTFLSSPQLDLGDIDPEVFAISVVNGIVIHGPMAKGFNEDDQNLGFLNLAIPDESYSRWGLNISVAEIVTRFEHAEIGKDATQRDIAKPVIKRQRKRKDGK